ncbi:metallophosphoesterase family protein [Paenibacillus oceani]|uniref:DNA repair exonuclease n=1 Tax=Paenibacillus oceani TaxID=2772510 RepID=A0A927CGN9_9BACL|nr:DNA repair exonuclease [Paenibacillus oceani]MBD2865420.1 DNA repair exonuclease [Paenibacillus oceani]
MRSFRFIHAADLHLDSPFKGLSALPSAIRERIRESTFRALRHLVELAVTERADFVLIAGDVYDSADRSLKAQLRFQSAVGLLAERGIPVYVIHGNHDPDDGNGASLRWPDTVRFFSSGEQADAFVVRDRSGADLACVHGWSYPTSAVTDNPLARFGAPKPGLFNIGLLHANVDGDAGHDNYAPCSVKELQRTGFDYWALGHIHTRAVLSENPAIVYPGNIQGRSVRETGPRGCCIVDVSESGSTAISFRPLDAVRWHTAAVSIEGLSTEQELRDRLEEELRLCEERSGGRPAIVRFRLNGRGPLHKTLRKPGPLLELTEEFRELERRRAESSEPDSPFVWIESVDVATASELDPKEAANRNGFIGDMLQLSAGLAGDGDSLRSLIEEALQPLLAHPKAGPLAEAMAADEREEWLKAAESLALGLVAEEEGWDE